MKNPPSIPPYRFHFTADGSPTLELSYNDNLSEYMHNSQGAFEESVYIYGQVLEEAMQASSSLAVLSLGLGLGYNEILTAALALKFKRSAESLSLTSFETETFLTENFDEYVRQGSPHPQFQSAYSWITSAAAERYGVDSRQILLLLQQWRSQQRWKVEGEFRPFEIEAQQKWNVFLYDAFSRKMSPQLWSEEALSHLLSRHVLTPCFFTTYAATGALKRSLRSQGFSLRERPGFSGKRDSTLAFKSD